ncbi:hypothetical protein RJ640_003906 [Escallonia rubra]|uniref:Exostosin GT47 domain-containing protein n=1 Tax=Escallonia rubra TaxID=112253 RepID=A0AA88R0P7_9ASTE|nr:hypothetical protein RJ640_003906 [Escallonia rubra]
MFASKTTTSAICSLQGSLLTLAILTLVSFTYFSLKSVHSPLHDDSYLATANFDDKSYTASNFIFQTSYTTSQRRTFQAVPKDETEESPDQFKAVSRDKTKDLPDQLKAVPRDKTEELPDRIKPVLKDEREEVSDQIKLNFMAETDELSDVYHSPEVFRLNYAEMERKFKVYIYPDGDPGTFYQTPRKLTGKYASEGYFFQNIRESRFRTDDPDQADLFFIPISCHKMRGKGSSVRDKWYQSLVTTSRAKQGATMAGKDTSVGASGVAEENVVVVERGRDPLPPAGGKKGGRGQSNSRDELASLNGRTGHLEIAMGDVKDHVGMVEQNLQTLEDHVLEELESLKRAVGAQDELRESDYVKEFTTLMLHIPNMMEEDLLFNFVDGLQSWAKKELQRRGVKDVDEAIAMAESLTEYDRGEGSSRSKEEGEASEGNHANGGGESPKVWYNRGNQASTSKSEGRGKLEEKRVKNKPKDGCFFCGGPHWAKDCRRQGKLAALVKEKDEEKAERESVRIGSIQVLNALQGKKKVPQVPTGEGQASKSEGLLYMEAKLNGKLAHVLMDTGATHNFITMGEAERLGLNVVDGGGWLKTVNAEAKPLQGTIRRVEMCLGKWKGFVNFSVARMDDFKVVLGLDFLRQVNALVSPYNNAVCIMERGAACVVPMFGGTSSTMTSMRLSGMRLAQEVEREEAKKSEGTYLASLKVEDRVVLHEFEKRQPPRRKVGDQGKLDRGAKPQNVVPCGMAPPKEEKLSTTSKAKGEIIKLIKKGLQRDPLAKELLQLVKSGKTQRYRVKGDLLYTKDGRVYVPKWRDLRKMVIRGSHDT